MKITSPNIGRQTSKDYQGVALILLATVFFCAMGLGVRVLRGTLRADMLVFYRCLIQVLILLPWLKRSFKSEVKIPLKLRMKSHLLRSGLGLFSMLFFYLTLQEVPLAMATLLGMSSIFWATLLSWFFLGERWSFLQLLFAATTCVGIGLSVLNGQMFKGQIGTGALWSFSLVGILYGLLCGVMRGAALTTLRSIRQNIGSVEIVFFFGLFCFLALLPVFWLKPVFPQGGEEIFLLGGVGIAGTLGQLLLSMGFKHTKALVGSLCTLQSTFLNILIGFVFLGETPPLNFIFGTLVVLVGVAGLLTVRWRQNKLAVYKTNTVSV